METPRWLHLRVPATLSEAPGNESILSDPDDMPPLTTELSRLIRDAATDENIIGIRFEVTASTMGWGQTQEIRSAVSDFVASGKECIAWAESFSNKEYMLASPCSTVALAPAGVTLVNGISMTQSYYAELFEEWDIHPNFAHVGDFKSAVEPFERSGPSEAASEATNALLDSLYGQLVATIADGRQLSSAAAEALIDDPPITPDQVLESGMVTSLKYRDEIFPASTDEFELISTSDYLRKRRRVWQQGEQRIAVLYASGTIVNGSSGQSLFGGEFIGDRSINRHLREVQDDPSIKALVIRVNSPGGSGSASDAIWREVQKVKELGKPVVISMSDYAASGGYYISMGADHIYAQPGTLTGSIGVFGGKVNIAGLYEKLGISLHTYRRGKYSTLFSSTEDFDEEQRAKYQDFLESFYKIFVTKASEGRNMSYDELHKVAQGRVWTGEQALDLGLVDSLGGLNDAMDKAAELSNLAQYGTIILPQRKSFLEQIIEELDGGPIEQMSMPLPDEVLESMDATFLLDKVLKDNGVAAMLPMQIDIH
jgi:protease IV